ncbi:hypothetical protein MKW94_025813, partial [Papaver nudicaule]|nr:hypothetical protein [Papaver nudicaule]
METLSIRDGPELSLKDQEEMKIMARLRDRLNARHLYVMERSAKAEGREFKRPDAEYAGYDCLLLTPKQLDRCFFKSSGASSFEKALTDCQRANGVE